MLPFRPANRKGKEMATVRAFIRTTTAGGGKVRVRFRLRDSLRAQVFHTSEIEVLPGQWDAARESIKAKVVIAEGERVRINKVVAERKALMAELYTTAPSGVTVTSAWMEEQIERRLHPELFGVDASGEETFFAAFETFITTRPAQALRKKGLRTVMHALQRYEKYKRIEGDTDFTLSLGGFDEATLRDFVTFMAHEAERVKWYPELYAGFIRPKAVGRGQNYITALLSALRTFFNWVRHTERPTSEPFRNFSMPPQVYGTPYYITIGERNALYAADLSDSPDLAAIRDIFVFQCFVGCRVGDLQKLTPDNVTGGALEYIPRKTKEGRPVTVRVPLSVTAAEIVERYAGSALGRLLPVPELGVYNAGIRAAFTRAGLTRVVTVLNPTTREEEHKPLNEIASSHLARRTFVGNLYKQVADPNLIGSLSGHTEGSAAFARYRQIDEEMKVGLVKLLE
jgi:integrase